MEKETNCPLCALYRKCEETEIDRSLGGSVMEPDARIRVNEKGICCRHHQQLFAMQNRLGHALLVDSHTKDFLVKMDSLDKTVQNEKVKKGLFGGKSDASSVLADELETLSTGCKVFNKPTFGSVNLANYLVEQAKENEIEEIELCGLCTDICVISNAFVIKANLTEVPVSVDASCCAGVTPESHKNALAAMKMCQVTVYNE